MSNDLSLNKTSLSSTNNDEVINTTDSQLNGSIIGQQFVSNIPMADLVMKSTVYTPEPTYSSSLSSNTGAKKTKRRVTFNLEVNQVQTIPVYSSYSSASSSSEDLVSTEKDEPELSNTAYQEKPNINTFTTNNIEFHQDVPPKSYQEQAPICKTKSLQDELFDDNPCAEPFFPNKASSSSSKTSSIIQQPMIPIENASKRAKFDALEHRKLMKGYDTTNQTVISESAFWYPLNPTLPIQPLISHDMSRYNSNSLPILRSLETTEKLISQTIERYKASYPNLTQSTSSNIQSQPSTPNLDDLALMNSQTKLIMDSDEDEFIEDEFIEEEETTFIQNKEPVFIESDTDEVEEDYSFDYINTLNKTPSLEEDNDSGESITLNNKHLDMQHSANSIMYNEGDEDSDSSIGTASPLSPVNLLENEHNISFDKGFQPKDVISFEKYSPPELSLPFEKTFISISTKNKNTKSAQSPTYIKSHHSSLKMQKKRSIFFIKVFKTEQLDLPIDNDNTNIYCSIRYQNLETKSENQQLAHKMNFNHEIRLVDVDPDQQIAITIHVDTNRSKKSNPAFSNWYHKMKSNSDLERYMHEKDGSICQTLFSPSRFMEEKFMEQTASLMLVNGWYRTIKSPSNSSTSSLLSSFKKKRPTSPTALHKEKAVGKIYIKCFFVETYGDTIPLSMDEAIEGLNAKRFHETIWQSGYLSQLGGNEEELTKKYFVLRGGVLGAFSEPKNGDERVLLHQFLLSKVEKLKCDHFIVERPTRQHSMKTPTTLLSELEYVVMSNDDTEEKSNDRYSEDLKNGFQLYFENGDTIQFSCDSLEERNRWASIIEVMICKLPALPDWIRL